MARGAAASTGKAPPPAAAESEELLSEVKAFASQLGLDSGEHAFDDFAPQQSKQKLASSKRKHSEADEGGENNRADGSKAASSDKKRSKAETSSGKATSKGQAKDRAAAAVKGGTPVVPSVSDAMAAAIKERTWNTGVGPRPGEGKRSLMDRNGPALWYEAAAAFPPLPGPGAAGAAELSDTLVAQMRQRGEALIEREATVFEAELGRKNGQDARWLQQVRRSGTTSDKVAALTLLLQESAVANLKSLETLVGWVAKSKGGRSVVGQAIDAAREAFVTVLLPDRKLRWLSQQPLAALEHNKAGEKRLLLWTLEDALKQRYAAFVAALESSSKASLDWVKERALRAACELLRLKPEAEAQLLTLLVNKLGDPSRKIASKAVYLLGALLEEHPAMKTVVVAEVQRFMFRSGLQERARYYAVVFLNQLQLSRHPAHGGSELARQLIGVYLTMFQLVVTSKVGHAAAAQVAAEERTEATRIARRKAKGKGRGKASAKNAKTSAVQGPKAEEVDAKMIAALVAGVRRAFPFVEENDVEAVLEEHSPALFRVCHTAPLGVALQVLALLLQLMSSRRSVSDRFYRALYAVMLSPEVVRSSKAPMFVALVFKAMKADVSINRVAAFAKRLLQIALQAPAPFAAGILFLLSEVLKVKPALWPSILQPEEAPGDVEKFKDAPDEFSPTTDSLPPATGDTPSQEKASAPLEAADKAPVAAKETAEPPWPKKGGYDMHKREPTYCGAEGSCWWEVAVLQGHTHPSVTAMATAVLAGMAVVYDGDPLRDLSLPAFLDKFVRRKQKPKQRGASIMQPLAPLDDATAAAAAAQPGTEAFATMAAEDVRPDAAFFHKFYAARAAAGGANRKRSRLGEDGDSEDSEAEIDAVVDEEEEAGVEGPDAVPDGGYDYSQLAEALQGGGDDSDASDGSNAEAADVADGNDSADDVNPLELASPTTSEEGGNSFGSYGEGVDDDGGSSESGRSISGSDSEGALSDGAFGSDSDSSEDEDGGFGKVGDFASADAWASRISQAEEQQEAAAVAVAAADAPAASDAAEGDGNRTGGKVSGSFGGRTPRNNPRNKLSNKKGRQSPAAKLGRPGKK